jgi:beta-lactam-binding protein with PASTA domain/tRNA A-37 threonylcarbamoyl transferase component Bud32
MEWEFNMDNTDKYIGMMLDNRYEILERVGSGGMAVVYKARCHRLNRLVAVKILREEYARDDDFRRRFHAESQAVAMLSHPNIVAVYDVNKSNDIEYLVMELIDGITLIQYMSRRGVLNWREALHFTTQIVRALEHAHSRGIIHRDIKPHNIMVLRDGSVKVADFGIARFAASQNTLTQEALGSVHYISPEQAKGSHIDARSDIYSVGVVLYEMLTGRLPFEGDSAVSVAIQHINSMPLLPREIVPGIPQGLEEITMKAMASDLSKRYVSASEMYRDLEEFRKNPNIVFNYDLSSYEIVQESVKEPTKKLPAVNEAGRRVPTPVSPAGAVRKKESTMTRSKRPRGQSLAMVFAVMAVLMFVGGLFFFLWKVIGPILNPESDAIPVPDLMGQMIEDVLENEEYTDNFEIVENGEGVYHDSLPGTIIDQKPAANRRVKKGETIYVTISKGRKYIELESYRDMEWRNAESALLKLGLTVKEKIFETNDEVLKDNVIRTDPAAGSTLLEGEAVTLYISLGPAVDKVKMPNLIGRTEEAAIKAIEKYKLTLGGITRVESDSPEGEVVWQSIETDLEVDEGSVVFLQVSLGPPATPTPSPSQPPEETQTPDDDNGDQPVTKTVKIKLDQKKETLLVTVKVNGETVYEETVETSQEYIYVPVTGKGTVLLEIYFDGKLTYSDPFRFEP